ncbi:Rieske 2Fe-2S domain-containing protein [Cryptosporangium sp. NPDC051539]|uniref:Rieske 2Fe-2S domain-containing protein n=1 Tax=Cryptosporangium sp. NPDC051539 TaxID=3363962 RepID=UPI0037A82E4A
MITVEETEELTKVGPGTPTGEYLRQFWLPFLGSDAIEAGGQPFPVRLMSENLVAFRREDGQIGLVDVACAHRRAPLLYARNEGCGLRCVYHGWQYDIDGQCTDMPAEPATSRFKKHIKIKAYPCRERNGVVWTFLGQGEPPELPEVEWNLLPPDRVHVSFRVQETDWLSSYEGEIDSAHAPILHGRLDSTSKRSRTTMARSGRPVFDVMQQAFGASIGARRTVPDTDELYWRVNQFVMPFYTLVPPKSEEWAELTGHAWVPIDDHHTLAVGFTYLPDRPLKDRMADVFTNGFKGRETGHPSVNAYDPDVPQNVPYWKYVTKYRHDTNYRFDYGLQQTTYFSGLPGLWVQDVASQNGAQHASRSQEHLTSSDAGIVIVRQVLRDCVAAYAASGELPAAGTDPSSYRVRAVAGLLKSDEAWVEALSEFMFKPVGDSLGYRVP